MSERIYQKPFYDFVMQECWFCCILEGLPAAPEEYKVASTFHTTAKEAETNPHLKEATYNFVGAVSWNEVGLQLLIAAGWRPDCAMGHTENIEKLLPPKDPKGLLIVQSPWVRQGGAESLGNEGYDSWMMGEEGGLHVSVGTFFQDGIGASCAWIKRPDGVVFTQGWVLGGVAGVAAV